MFVNVIVYKCNSSITAHFYGLGFIRCMLLIQIVLDWIVSISWWTGLGLKKWTHSNSGMERSCIKINL